MIHMNPVLRGVVSWGEGCGRQGKPASMHELRHLLTGSTTQSKRTREARPPLALTSDRNTRSSQKSASFAAMTVVISAAPTRRILRTLNESLATKFRDLLEANITSPLNLLDVLLILTTSQSVVLSPQLLTSRIR